VYLLVFHAYINEMRIRRSKIPSKKSRPYIYIYIHDVKFLALLGAPYIYIYIYIYIYMTLVDSGLSEGIMADLWTVSR
jgi:hypothetical protein